ncbi:MAG: hypothetical protein KGI92_13590 [Alphaproteobacteria bacterium]|nr:hypothetical protein [Alphaproteobacteria bacterium]
MSFAISLLFFVLGSALVALCLLAIPGRGDRGEAGTATPHGHGSSHH